MEPRCHGPPPHLRDQPILLLRAGGAPLGSFPVATFKDLKAALDEAAALDARLAAGEDVGPLAGIPIGVKDLEDAEGLVTSEGSLLFKDRVMSQSPGSSVPANEDALIQGKAGVHMHGTAVLAFASWTDWRWRRAPNVLWLVVGGGGLALLAGVAPLGSRIDTSDPSRNPPGSSSMRRRTRRNCSCRARRRCTSCRSARHRTMIRSAASNG